MSVKTNPTREARQRVKQNFNGEEGVARATPAQHRKHEGLRIRKKTNTIGNDLITQQRSSYD